MCDKVPQDESLLFLHGVIFLSDLVRTIKKNTTCAAMLYKRSYISNLLKKKDCSQYWGSALVSAAICHCHSCFFSPTLAALKKKKKKILGYSWLQSSHLQRVGQLV